MHDCLQSKAASILRQAGQSGRKRRNPATEGSPATKRPCDEPSAPAGPPKCSDDKISQLLARRSTHATEANSAEQERENLYFSRREVEEKLESRMTSLMELKDVGVVTCKEVSPPRLAEHPALQCDYTAQHAADRCSQLGHALVRHKASKRWFRCKECGCRTVSFQLLPTKPCSVRSAAGPDRGALAELSLQVVRAGGHEGRAQGGHQGEAAAAWRGTAVRQRLNSFNARLDGVDPPFFILSPIWAFPDGVRQYS